MNILAREKQIQVISALVEGSSIRSVERMTGVHRDTIMRLLVRVGNACEALMRERVQNIECRSLQIDEIWTFIEMKRRTLVKKLGQNGHSPHAGDCFVFYGLDPDTKLVPCFQAGKRDRHTAMAFSKQLAERVSGRVQITTDAFNGYPWAIGNTFGLRADYSQLNKVFRPTFAGRGRYSPPNIVGTRKVILWGNPDPRRISTSMIERKNLTMRMHMRRFTRLTNGFSRKFENLVAALNLHFAWYNFVRVHRTLKTTPAVAAGIVDREWTINKLLFTR